MKKLSGLFVLMALVVSCTKEKAFEFVPLKRTVSKDMFNKEDFGDLKADQIAKLSPEEKKKFRVPRIAVMSYGQATRTASASMPYFQGRTKLVEYEISEKKMEVRELESDPRFADNPTNSKTIMVFPVRHVDYECQKDAYGECQNKEIEDEHKDWKEKRYIEIDFENAKILDTDELPVEMSNLITGCYVEKEQKLIADDIDKGVFNYKIQKTYTIAISNPACRGEIEGLENLSDLNLDVQYMYSMVRADQISSKDYKPVQYKKADEETFGFFNTKNAKLDVDNNSNENSDEVLLNRWNPERKVITYYLSDEFNKPEYDYILDATKTAIQNLNNGLAEAQTGVQIKLEQSTGKQVGDLRNSMIVMVEDPLASRIIGYGPTVANPLTGEIVSGRTVMYLGTIKTIVKRTYEDMREELLAAKQKKEGVANISAALAVENLKHRLQSVTGMKSMLAPAQALVTNATLQNSIDQMNLANKADILKAKVEMNKNQTTAGISNSTLAQIKSEIFKYKKLEGASLSATPSKFIDKRMDVLSKNNVYPEELFNAEYALKSTGVDKMIAENMKPWAELTAGEKEEIIRAVLPAIWIPTLVHEMGHNMGLRHNFAGSEDKANFYSQEELERMGVTHAVPYSSVMDYSFKSTNELPTLGKYDIAALKYGYKREVEAVGKDGQVAEIVSVANDLGETEKDLAAKGLALKQYRYCTDEHVSANPTCNRFDEGTNLVEIATHYITSYDDMYNRINRRNGRKNFSLAQEPQYLERMSGGFYDLRLMYELYERIKNDYGVEEGSKWWSEDPELKEIYQASTLSGQFFLSILLTPDLTCAVAAAEQPKIPMELVKIRNLDPNAISCFTEQVKATVARYGEQVGLDLVVVGQGGKSFQSRRAPSNLNSAYDQIDVQGIWIDKMLALEYLFTRELGSGLFDGNTQTFLSHGAVGPNIENVLSAILLNRGAVETPFYDAEGNIVEFIGDDEGVLKALPVAINLSDDHWINAPLIEGLADRFGMPKTQTTFSKELIRTLGRLIPSEVESTEAAQFLDAFSVHKDLPNSANKKDYISIQVGSQTYFASKYNKVAATAIQSLPYARILKGMSVLQVKKLIEMKKNKEKLPKDAAEEFKVAYKLSEAILQAYVDGLIAAPDVYEKLLVALLVE
jgi:hypothetical protein